MQLSLPFVDVGGGLLQGASQTDVVAFERGQLDFPFFGVRTAAREANVLLVEEAHFAITILPLSQCHFQPLVLVLELLLRVGSGLGGRVVHRGVFDRFDIACVETDLVRRAVRNCVLNWAIENKFI